MSNCADAARRSPDDQLREVATILATGFLRLRQRPAPTTKEGEKNLPKFSPNGFEVPPETRLSVRVG